MTLSEYKGKIILLHFFAAFSKASTKQLPHIQKLHEKYGEKGLVVIGLTLEQYGDRIKELHSKGITAYPILLDGKGVFKSYRLGQIPDVCIVNEDLVISSMYMGFNSRNEGKIEIEIRELLESAPNED